MKILPGLNVTFSWKRALGVTNVKRSIARKTGIPTTRQGLERKIGNAIIGATFSFTCKRKDFPRVASAASFVVMFPATSVAFTVTP